jgi:hypothetical protein
MINIINDTLKKKDSDGVIRWSRTSLTMLTAWISVLFSFYYDLIKNGFNEASFIIMVGVALGSKLTDAWTKRINPIINNDEKTD